MNRCKAMAKYGLLNDKHSQERCENRIGKNKDFCHLHDPKSKYKDYRKKLSYKIKRVFHVP